MRGSDDKNVPAPGVGAENRSVEQRARCKGEALPQPDQAHDRIAVDNHRKLLAMARVLAARIEKNPEFSVMLLANPVLALRQYGIALSKDMQRHVLETLRHPPKLRERRRVLERSLEAALGERAKPNDSKWMAKLVFELRGLSPLDTGDSAPTYRPALDSATIARLQRLRPAATKRYAHARTVAESRRPEPAPSALRARIASATPSPSVRLLDLDAPPPRTLKAAARPPKTLALEEAWFYKDDPIVRDAVELGQIERRAFPFKTPAQFRDLAAGRKLDAFGAYVRAVRIPRSEP